MGKSKQMLEATACKDGMHLVLETTPKYSIPSIMGYLKGKSSLMIFARIAITFAL